MKLDTTQKGTVENTFSTEAIEDDHPAMDRLKEVFGDHTFFLDADGLHIIEPNPEAGAQNGAVIKLASWTDDRTQLQAHEPEVLPVMVELGA
jgi:hypothetical protein